MVLPDFEEAFVAATRGRRQGDEKAVATRARDRLEDRSANFERWLQSRDGTVLSAGEYNQLGGAVSDWLYEKGLARIKSGREVVNRIYAHYTDEMCAYCGFTRVSQLDHFMPKSSYADLCITPINLVPACNVCNQAKSDAVPEFRGDIFLHPYEEAVGDWGFIQATVHFLNTLNGETGVILRFVADPPMGMFEETRTRLTHQFTSIKWCEECSKSVASELVSWIRMCQRDEYRGKPGLVQNFLRSRALGYETDRVDSAVKRASLIALSNSREFCTGVHDLQLVSPRAFN